MPFRTIRANYKVEIYTIKTLVRSLARISKRCKLSEHIEGKSSRRAQECDATN